MGDWSGKTAESFRFAETAAARAGKIRRAVVGPPLESFRPNVRALVITLVG